MPITTHSPEEFRFRLAETLRRERLVRFYGKRVRVDFI